MCKVLAISALLVGYFISSIKAGKFYYYHNPTQLSYQHPSRFNNPPVYSLLPYAPVRYPARKIEQWTPVESVPFIFGGGSSKQVAPFDYHQNHKYISSADLFLQQEPTTIARTKNERTNPTVYPAAELKHDVVTTPFPTTPFPTTLSPSSKEEELRHHHHEDHHNHHKHKHNHSHHHHHHHHHHKQTVLNTDTTKADATKGHKIQFQMNNFLKEIEHKLLELKSAVFKYARLLDEAPDLQDLDQSFLVPQDDEDYSATALEARNENDTETSEGRAYRSKNNGNDDDIDDK